MTTNPGWTWFPGCGLHDLRIKGRGEAIYLLCRGTEIVYVGRSRQLLPRIGAHLEGFDGLNKQFDRIAFFTTILDPFDSRTWAGRIEAQLIHLLHPIYNLSCPMKHRNN